MFQATSCGANKREKFFYSQSYFNIGVQFCRKKSCVWTFRFLFKLNEKKIIFPVLFGAKILIEKRACGDSSVNLWT